jgi:hypothetical protein
MRTINNYNNRRYYNNYGWDYHNYYIRNNNYNGWYYNYNNIGYNNYNCWYYYNNNRRSWL